MTTIYTQFDRELMKQGTALVKKYYPRLNLYKSAWVWKAGRQHWEFHGPESYYWHGSASSAYEARYKGWMAWLASKGVKL